MNYEVICQDDLSADHEYRQYSSPTILKNGRIVFGQAIGSDGGCSLEIPTFEELNAKLAPRSDRV